jgi:hypothetical protein
MSLSKEGQSHFDNVPMFIFSGTILLMCMRIGYMMSDSYLGEKEVKFFILSTPISLYDDDLTIKEPLYKGLKFLEPLEELRLVFKEINPSKFTKIIDKANKIFKTTNRFRCRTPNI